MIIGCGDSGPKAGTERGPCFANGTCNEPLICRSELCVDALAAPQAALRDSLVDDVMGKATDKSGESAKPTAKDLEGKSVEHQ